MTRINQQESELQPPGVLIRQVRWILHGALAGAGGGGLTAMAMAIIAAGTASPVHAPGPWLATTGLAALLSMVMGAWSGARSGILTSLFMAVLKKHRLAALGVAPLVGFSSGLLHGLLGRRDLIPSVHLERPVEIMESIPFYVAVQLGAAFFTLWWLHPARLSTDQ